jgi:P-type E1-E2 ATPase
VVFRENGILGELAGKTLKIGSEDFLTEEIRALKSENQGFQSEPGAADVSQVYMSREGRLCGVFEFGDTLRPGTGAAIARLKACGYRVALVSGDGDGTVRAVACRIGLGDARGGMLPADKAAFVADLQFRGDRVAMIGDGVNDAPALVQSDLGIAVHSGSHLGKEAADITLMRGDPGQIPEFIALAQTVNRTIHQNLWCAFGYNIVSIPIAMSGLLTPLVAVCAMLLSSLTVIGNTLRLARRPGGSCWPARQAVSDEESRKV